MENLKQTAGSRYEVSPAVLHWLETQLDIYLVMILMSTDCTPFSATGPVLVLQHKHAEGARGSRWLVKTHPALSLSHRMWLMNPFSAGGLDACTHLVLSFV